MNVCSLVMGIPRVRKERLAHYFGVSPQTIHNRLKSMEKEIESGRYPSDTIIRDGSLVLVNILAFDDFLEHRVQLSDAIARKHVPPYNPAVKAEHFGWNYNIFKS